MNKAVFLDRDGVINKDIGYVWKKENFIWIEGAKDAIKLLNHYGYLVIVVTNQKGIALNLYQHDDVIKLHNEINEELKLEDIHIDGFFYCPHSDEDNCTCRKPKPGMINNAIKKLNIDRKKSFLIGDRDRDIEAAKAANISGYKFNKKNLYNHVLNLLLTTWRDI